MLRPLLLLTCMLAGAACDPFGFWRDEPIGIDEESEALVLEVTSPAAGLDGLIDFARADGSACAPEDDGCIHVGAVREVHIAQQATCEGLTLRDTLELFTWTCRSSEDGIIGRGVLRDDKGLADIVDTDALVVREDSLELLEGARLLGRSAPAVWWSSPVRAAAADALLDEEGTVYVAGDETGAVRLAGSRIALVVRAGEALSATTGEDAVSAANPVSFLWLEGTFGGGDFTVSLREVRWLLARRLQLRPDPAGEGMFAGGRNLSLIDVDVLGGVVGLRITNAQRVRFERLRTFACRDALLIDAVVELVAQDLVLSSSSSSAIYLNGGTSLRWRGVVLIGQSYGVSGFGASDVTFADLTTIGTEVAAIDVSDMTRLEVTGILSVNDLIGVRINDATSTGLRFADIAAIGPGSRVFSFPDGVPAGTAFEGKLLVGAGVECHDASVTCDGLGFTLIAAGPDTAALVGVVADDAVQTSDDAGRASIGDIDGARFDTPTRAWSRGDALIGGAAARGACADVCQIVDVALTAGSALIGAVPIEKLRVGPTGGFLERARELVGDGDGLCEPSETCAAAIDIGAYQGHGGLREPRATTVAGAVFELADAALNGF